MSHYRGVKTKMRNLSVVHDVLMDRGYVPHCLDLANNRVPLEQAEMLRIPPEQISPYTHYSIKFELNNNGEVITKTDTDVLKTGRNSSPELVNRAGGGVNREFENAITTDWAIKTAINTGEIEGFKLTENNVVRNGNEVRIKMWRMPSTAATSTAVQSSNTIVL